LVRIGLSQLPDQDDQKADDQWQDIQGQARNAKKAIEKPKK